MEVLEGKSVADKIKATFESRINSLKIKPNIAILGIIGNNASNVYIRKIQKNCEKYGIGCDVKLAESEDDFIKTFNQIRKSETYTGIMFQQPLPNHLLNLINYVRAYQDIEGIGTNNMGKLFVGKDDAIIPCTSKAVIEILDYYQINLEGKKVAVVGRSNIVGKPLIPQLLERNATVTICHSKTKRIEEELKQADVVIMAIGKANFLKKEHIKNGVVLIDVGINLKDGKIVGDIDFEDIKEKAYACTPVPGGVGVVTSTLLINNIIKSNETFGNHRNI